MHIINAEEQHIPPYGAFTPIMSCTAQAASRRNPGHAGNACPGEKCSVTWISPVYRPAGETVIGYCYLRYRERHAYRFTVENSVYIDPAYQRQGAEKPYSIMP